MRWLIGICFYFFCSHLFAQGVSVYKINSVIYDGKLIELIGMDNSHGMSVKVTNYAGTLMDICIPDRRGNRESVVLGFDSLENYLKPHPKFGSTIGRYANRIAGASIALNGKEYVLDNNNNGNCIHGGFDGFHRQTFKSDSFYVVKDTAIVRFKYESRHLDGGFPGNLSLAIYYKLTEQNELVIEYEAVTDRATVINLTNHIYFNLSGGRNDVLDHFYRFYADSVTVINTFGLPTGKLMDVANTNYDFKAGSRLRERIVGGAKYDINYQLRKEENTLSLAAVVTDTVSGRRLCAYTTEPGMQFYVPSLDMGRFVGHGGKKYGRYYGFCLEMQHYPDSPHFPHFPTTVLLPGNVYRQITVYKFDVID